MPATLTFRGVGTRQAQGSGPRVRPPLPVNYAGGWHRCSSYSSFPGNFRPGIPPPPQRAASPARPGPQAPSRGGLAPQPWVPNYWEGSRRRRPRPHPCPLDWGPLRKPASRCDPVIPSYKLRLGRRGCLQDLWWISLPGCCGCTGLLLGSKGVWHPQDLIDGVCRVSHT